MPIPNNTLYLTKQRTVCNLHFEGRGTKYISMITGISRKAVQQSIQKLNKLKHLAKDDIMKMGNKEFIKLFD